MLAGGDVIGRGLAVQQVDAGELADWLPESLGPRRLAARVATGGLAARVTARGMVRVLMARQEPQHWVMP